MRNINKYIFYSITLLLFISLLASSAAATTSYQSISISGSAQNNYQMNVTIPYKVGMSTDFANIRFYANNTMENSGIAIPYWIESKNDNVNVTVLFPLPAGCTKVYCEWGIDGQTTSQSNATAVFDIYDDFIGTTLDPSWTYDEDPAANSYAVAANELTFTYATNSYAHIQKKGIPNTLTAVAKIKRTIAAVDYSWAPGIDIWFKANNHAQSVLVGSGPGTKYCYIDITNGAAASNIVGAWNLGTYYYLKTIITATNYYQYYSNDGITWTQMYAAARPASWTVDANSLMILGAGVEQTGYSTNPTLNNRYSTIGSNVDAVYDWVRVQKYNATPPTATLDQMNTFSTAFIADVVSGTLPLTATFTDQTTGSPTGWQWNFGDGTANSTTKNPAHIYYCPGTYNVTLTATDGGINTQTLVKPTYITANQPTPTASFSGNITTGTIPVTVKFNDSSTINTLIDNSSIEAGLPLSTAAASGTVVQSSSYARTGSKSMSAISTNATADCYIQVKNNCLNLLPSTQYHWEVWVYSPTDTHITTSNMFLQENGGSWSGIGAGYINGTTGYQALSAGTWTKIYGTGTTSAGWIGGSQSRLILRPGKTDSTHYDTTNYIYYDDFSVYPVTYAWIFGDGGTSTSYNPSYVYNNGGVYTVSENVTTAGMSNTQTRTSYIVAYNVTPTASFTTNVSNVNYLSTIGFNNTSVGLNITGFYWQFGDGATSNTKNTSHKYAIPGLYTANLTVTNDGGNNTSVSQIINATDVPVTDFTANRTGGNPPFAVQFNDTSVAYYAPTSWQWNFGDGTTNSTVKNATHTFTTIGQYNVTLTVTNQYGSTTVKKSQYITLTNDKSAYMTIDVTGSAINNYQVVVGIPWEQGMTSNYSNIRFYTNNTMENGGTSIPYWLENITSSSANVWFPLPAGCTKIICEWNIPGQTASQSNATAVFDIYDDFNGTTLDPSWTWDKYGYGTETVSNSELRLGFATNSYNHIQKVGLPNALIAITKMKRTVDTRDYSWAPGMDIWFKAQNHINNIMANNAGTLQYSHISIIDSADSYSPLAGTAVLGTYAYLKTVITDTNCYFYYSNDGVTWTLHSSKSRPASWVINSNSLFIIGAGLEQSGYNGPTLNNAYSSVGASDDAVYDWVRVQKYSATSPTLVVNTTIGFFTTTNFTANPMTGTAPLLVQFNDTTIDPVVSWNWNFGNGNTSTAQNPTNWYSTAGSYNVSLNTTTTGGEWDVITRTITVYNATPVSNFTSNMTTGYKPLAVQFNDTSIGANITAWLWTFGDGEAAAEQNVTHVYTEVGLYNVSLNISNDGGYNITTKVQYINVTTIPPLASFTGSPLSGSFPLNVQFNDTSTNAPTGWLWQFGDGTTSTSKNATRTYNNVGVYTVNLTTSNAGGTNTTSSIDYITVFNKTPVAAFTSNVTTGLEPLSVLFTDQSANLPSSWLWDFGDGENSTQQNATHEYLHAGLYNISLTAFNDGGDNSTTMVNYINVTPNITVFAPVANFSTNNTGGVAPLAVQFIDHSENEPTNYTWNFGDGVGSYAQNPTHVYDTPGVYSITLNVSNSAGMDSVTAQDFITVTAVPVAPIANFTTNVSGGLSPLGVQFNDTSDNAPTSWLWNFGDSITSTDKNPIHTYTTQGNYTVILAVGNVAGNNTTTIIDCIIVNALPNADFTSNETQGIIPVTIQFNDTSTLSPTSWLWNFGDNVTSTEQNPVHQYNNTGNYTVSLYVSNNVGNTTTTKQDYIYVAATPPMPPVAQFYGIPTNVTMSYEEFVPVNVQFNDTSIGSPTTWLWDFGDNNTSIEQNPMHTYNISGLYNVSLNVTNSIGMSNITEVEYINITQLPPNVSFTTNVSEGYAPLTVQFTNNTSGYTGNFYWDFGDGYVSTDQNPVHEYLNDGTYTTTLSVQFNGTNYSSSQVIIANYITRGSVHVAAAQPDQLSNVSANMSTIRIDQTSKQAAMYHQIKSVEGGTNQGMTFIAICGLIGGAAALLGFL